MAAMLCEQMRARSALSACAGPRCVPPVVQLRPIGFAGSCRSRALSTRVMASAAAVLAPPQPQAQQQEQPSAVAQLLASNPAVRLVAGVFQLFSLYIGRARDTLAAVLPKPESVNVEVRSRGG